MLKEMAGLGFEYVELSHGIRITLVPGILKAVEEGIVKVASCNNFCPLPNGFTHLTAYGIPADATDVDLGAVRVGPNGMGEKAWSGPQPPAGHGVHHYYFWVYALSSPVSGTPTREEFLAENGDAVIEQARVVGTFES